MQTITRGKKYRDTITGFEGVATAQCRYLSGCDHIQLAALVDGIVREPWFDITRLEPVTVAKKKAERPPPLSKARLIGGPASPPPGRSVPPDASASEE